MVGGVGRASFEEAMSSLGIVFGEGEPDLTSGRVRSVKRQTACRTVGELRAATKFTP